MASEDRRILTDAEVAELSKAASDPDFLRRLAADRTGWVEVDNPFRREVRPRRGTETAR